MGAEFPYDAAVAVYRHLSKKQEVGEKFYNKIMAIPMLMTVIMQENQHLIVSQDDFAATSIVIHNFSLQRSHSFPKDKIRYTIQ